MLFQLKYDLGRIRNFKEQLPIHKAFAYIPAGSSRLHSRHLQTVNALLRMNPETASLPDLNDCLPLHLAVYYNASLEVVQAVYNGKFGGSGVITAGTALLTSSTLPVNDRLQCILLRRW
jgi:hypothetical protein